MTCIRKSSTGSEAVGSYRGPAVRRSSAQVRLLTRGRPRACYGDSATVARGPLPAESLGPPQLPSVPQASVEHILLESRIQVTSWQQEAKLTCRPVDGSFEPEGHALKGNEWLRPALSCTRLWFRGRGRARPVLLRRPVALPQSDSSRKGCQDELLEVIVSPCRRVSKCLPWFLLSFSCLITSTVRGALGAAGVPQRWDMSV